MRASELLVLKAQFRMLLAAEAALGVLAALLLVGYFGLAARWCLPAFAVVLSLAAAGQIAFIAAFRRLSTKEA